MIKKLFAIIVLSTVFTQFATGQTTDKPHVLTSPDGKIKIELSCRNGQLEYRVSNKNEQLLANSHIAWNVGNQTIGQKAEITGVKEQRGRKTTYPILGGHSTATDNYRQMSVEGQDQGIRFTIEIRAFDDGVAFRLKADLPQATQVNDLTTFAIPMDAPDLWSQDRIDCYEGAHRHFQPSKIEKGRAVGPPMLYKTIGGTYVLITEAGLVDFAGMSLRSLGGGVWQSRMEGATTIQNGSMESPWRCIITGSLNTLVNTDMITNLSEPEHKIFEGDKSWIKPGASAWSWLTNDNDISVAGMKRFIDQAAAAGMAYNLVDEGWGHWSDPWGGIRELVEYGRTKGVETMIWKAYPDRAGIQGLQTTERLEAFFAKCAQEGVKGVKIDFFDKESQPVTKFYADALLLAARHKILVNFHGCNKPTGLNRTFPNELTREGIMGLEFGRSWADQNTVTPFTRFVAGHGDYTPLTFSKNFMGKTSAAHQVATSIIFTSPLMCYGGLPDDLRTHSLSEFILACPTVWDETVVLRASQVGQAVAFARRSGQDWYVAAITLKEQDSVNLELDFLGRGNYECRMARDTPKDQYAAQIETKIVNNKESLSIAMREEGGFVAKFSKIKK